MSENAIIRGFHEYILRDANMVRREISVTVQHDDDGKRQAVYVKVGEGENRVEKQVAARVSEIHPNIIVDYDQSGNVLGVEIL